MDKMATTDTGLPPICKISLVGIWIETVLYGTNCVVYGLCMFILLRGGKVATLRWVLVVVSTIISLLCTVHVGASLQQLLEASIYAPAGVPDYSTMYWLDYSTPLRVLKDNLYDTLVLAQDFILIWRLYVVFLHDWRVVVFPIILATFALGSAYAASAVSAFTNNGVYGSITRSLIISAWVLGFTLNVSVTAAIATRLWWVGRTIASLTATFTSTGTNRFASSIYITVESGAATLVLSVIVVALFTSSSPLSLAALDVIAQLVVLVPLLIVIQAVTTGRYHTPYTDTSKTIRMEQAQGEIRFRAGDFREEDSREDVPLDMPLSRSLSSAHGTHV